MNPLSPVVRLLPLCALALRPADRVGAVLAGAGLVLDGERAVELLAQTQPVGAAVALAARPSEDSLKILVESSAESPLAGRSPRIPRGSAS